MSREKKTLVLGASGGIGSLVYEHLKTRSGLSIVGTCHNHQKTGLQSCDITDLNQLSQLIERAKPDTILDFAGMAQERLCIEQANQAQRTNVDGAQNITTLADKLSIPVLFPATVNVFAGYQHKETCDEKTTPRAKEGSVYGASKIAAEKVFQTARVPHTLIRTDLVLAPGFGITSLFQRDQFAQIRINATRYPVLGTDFLAFIDGFIADPSRQHGITHLISPEFQSGIKLVDLATDIITRFDLAHSYRLITDGSTPKPRQDRRFSFPVYVNPDANNLATQDFVFISTQH